MPQTQTVPVSNPAHPSHGAWLQILLTALKAAVSIGPAVVAVVDPGDADLANKVGAIVGTVVEGIDPSQTPSA